MGDVYIYRQQDENRFTVGASKDFDKRKKAYERANPGLKLHRRINTPDHFALEKFIHNELAKKRDRTIRSESWYVVTSEEIDLAIQRTTTVGRQYIECKKKADAVRSSPTDGTWLEPSERLREIHARLSSLSIEKIALCQEEQILRMEAMAHIGKANGIEGLFEWPSHEERRFQPKVFALKYPDLYEEFRRLNYVRKFKLWGGQEDEESEDGSEQD